MLVSRNFFGAQIHSFEALLPAPACLAEADDSDAAAEDYRAVFIRAPAIMEYGSSVEVLAEYQLSPSEQESQVRALKCISVGGCGCLGAGAGGGGGGWVWAGV